MQDARLAGRLIKELKMLQDPPPGVCVWPTDEHILSRLEAQIQGPDGTVYSKGIFKLEVEIPDRYPFEPPNVKFITPVYHPNIDSGGRICHDILNMPPKGQWRPSLNIGAVLASIRVLLEEPNHDDGLMSDISAEYKHNRAIFDDKARRSTERYAMQNSAERDSEVTQDIDQAKASASQSTSSMNYATNHDTLARPDLSEVDRVGASKEALDEPSTTNPRLAASGTSPARPRQNLTAKLSLTKGSTSQGVRSCRVGGIAEAELSSPMGFGIERARETEVLSGPGSQIVSQPSESNGSPVASAGKATCHEPEDAVVELGRERSGGIDAGNICKSDAVICIVTKEKGKKLTLPKTKLLKLSRPQPSASECVQESTSTETTRVGLSHSKRMAQLSRDPVILLDSESDDEDSRFQTRSLSVKRKYERT